MTPEFQSALTSFFEGCKRIAHDHRMENFPTLPEREWRMDILQKRARIVQDSGVHCFVDLANGDVLKAASWAKPAKHARGNIFDALNGLGSMGPYGPAYLR